MVSKQSCAGVQADLCLQTGAEGGDTQTVSLHACIYEAKVSAVEKALDFGAVGAGVPSTSTLTLRNTGRHDALFVVAVFPMLCYSSLFIQRAWVLLSVPRNAGPSLDTRPPSLSQIFTIEPGVDADQFFGADAACCWLVLPIIIRLAQVSWYYRCFYFFSTLINVRIV